ncbi:ABC transporter permease [Pyxidicoccus fallax]|uniref:ABC transporter permease n=1 Tax=Pyxidicoccus fallax TaxID=394095 RepID=A0A848LRH5_9BACT|nr:ABC transporter permease [Pyxidicoccus fallax]NMO20242.1 ABC transporter permease [Pyxidicoccus fallax]NPC81095.1 ABC transporter permease [Pyxidicoccus fallax]
MKRRLASSAVALVGALLLVSLFLRLVPGDPVDVMLGEQATEVDRAALRRAVGLDLPWYEELGVFTRQLVTGELRTSLPPFQRKVLPAIGAALPYTLALTVASMLVALALALPLGVAAAARRGTVVDAAAMSASVAGVALPRFWLGPMLIIVFSLKLDWLPVSGAESWRHGVLPSLTLGLALAAFLARMTRASMLESLREDYVTVARAKGLSPRAVLWKHAFRNALLPLLTVLGLEFGTLLGGAIVTEKVFSWPGMGTLLLTAIEKRDYNTVRATVLVFTFCYVVVNTLTDAAYALADPRVRRRS